MRVLCLVDGFNVYHALDGNSEYRRYKWLDYARLAQLFTRSGDTVVGVRFFTAYAPWNRRKRARHERYVAALRTVGVTPVFGEFRPRTRTCRHCQTEYTTYEEKRTDVNIAVTLFRAALTDLYDTALIISGDSDLVPAVEAVRSRLVTSRSAS